MLKIRAPKEFCTGLLFIAIGALGFVLAMRYPFGTTLRMGPGYFPTVISCCTMLSGALILARSFVLDGEPITAVGWRPLLFILGSVLVFSYLITRAGLVVTAVLTSLVCGLAAQEMGRVELVILSLGLAAFCAIVFVYALGQPIPLWP